MLVFAHVSSMNTRRLGSSCFWSSCQRIRSAATSGRSCSAAHTIFFKGDLLLGEESPNRAIADADIARGKLAPYVMKRQIGRRGTRASSQSRSSLRRELRSPPIGLAATLPVRAVDAEGEVLDVLVQTRRNKRAALKLMRKLLKKYGFVPDKLVTDDLRSYGAAARDLGIAKRLNAVDGATTEPRIRINRPDDESARCKGSRASQCMQQHKSART